MTTKAVQKITFQEYLSYDDGTDNLYELVDGELVLMPPPSPLHEDIVHFLLVVFYQEIQRLGLDWIARVTNTGVRTIASRSRLPDVVVMTQEQHQSMSSKAPVLESAPLLIVEVISEGNSTADYRFKRSEYAATGILEYWIVDIFAGKVSVLQLVEGFYDVTEFRGSDRLVSHIFPEIGLTASQILEAKN